MKRESIDVALSRGSVYLFALLSRFSKKCFKGSKGMFCFAVLERKKKVIMKAHILNSSLVAGCKPFDFFSLKSISLPLIPSLNT